MSGTAAMFGKLGCHWWWWWWVAWEACGSLPWLISSSGTILEAVVALGEMMMAILLISLGCMAGMLLTAATSLPHLCSSVSLSEAMNYLSEYDYLNSWIGSMKWLMLSFDVWMRSMAMKWSIYSIELSWITLVFACAWQHGVWCCWYQQLQICSGREVDAGSAAETMVFRKAECQGQRLPSWLLHRSCSSNGKV